MLMLGSLTISILLVLLIVILLALIIEVRQHNFNLEKIPIRITVSGTRGKTSTVRLIASILRESGYKVLAKTTGTSPSYILPDGTEEKIKRRGLTNILEQKRLVKMAAKLQVDYLVSEIMSIQAENHFVESHMLLKPKYTVLTNLRPDHFDQADAGQMTDLYLNDLYPNSTLIIPEEELSETIKSKLHALKIRIISCSTPPSRAQNIVLAKALARELEVSESAIGEGIEKAKMDFGQLECYRFETELGPVIFANAFAANDPISSQYLIDEVRQFFSQEEYTSFGIFSFRKDRGERSQQWLDYLKSGGQEQFSEMLYFGEHSKAFLRTLREGKVMKGKSPESITQQVLAFCQGPSLVFGLVNIGGIGTELLGYWKQAGNKVEGFS